MGIKRTREKGRELCLLHKTLRGVSLKQPYVSPPLHGAPLKNCLADRSHTLPQMRRRLTSGELISCSALYACSRKTINALPTPRARTSRPPPKRTCSRCLRPLQRVNLQNLS